MKNHTKNIKQDFKKYLKIKKVSVRCVKEGYTKNKVFYIQTDEVNLFKQEHFIKMFIPKFVAIGKTQGKVEMSY